MMDTLDWAFEFRDAPDLDAAGETLTRKLESLVEAGPPATARDLTDRQTFEAIVAAFIARARERDFAYVRIPGFTDLFKSFTAQNVVTEDRAALSLERATSPTSAPATALRRPRLDPSRGCCCGWTGVWINWAPELRGFRPQRPPRPGLYC
jgi:hypothetical protein